MSKPLGPGGLEDVHDWRKRALAAEADRDWLREALRALAEEEKARHIVNCTCGLMWDEHNLACPLREGHASTKQGDVNGI